MKPPIILDDLRKRARTDCRIGLSAWADTSRLEKGHFYPRKTMTAEELATTTRWVARTPPRFLADVNFKGFLAQVQGQHPVAEKCDDLFSERELEEIARAAGALTTACSSRRCSSRTAPDREALIEELEERRAAAKSKRRRPRRAA